jgi:type II secretory pathway component HofQ
MSEKKEQKVNLQIQLDEDVAQGAYVNLAMVNHSDAEFTLDFIYVQPQQPKAKVRSRIISSPKHTKRLMEALKENIEKFEKRFGSIDISRPSPQEEMLH